MIEKEEKRKDVLDEKETKLQKDEEETMKQKEVLQWMLKDAQVKMDVAIKENDMLGVTVAKEMLTAAKEMLTAANEKLSALTVHRNEQVKIRQKIGKKRKVQVENLVKNVKKKI